MYKPGQLTTGIDRSYRRSIYKFIGEVHASERTKLHFGCYGAYGQFVFMYHDGYHAMEYDESQRIQVLPLEKQRLATPEEIEQAQKKSQE